MEEFMDKKVLAGMIDHTLLKPATKRQITKLCEEAVQYGFASVCVNPCHVKLAAKLLEGTSVKVCTVIGFPLGENTTKTKVDETKNAIKLGATEIDVVRASLEQAVADQILELERKMIFLATAITISPFLGLFGTVWGIMLAFTDLAIMGKADIQTLAPGVSGALLTTVLGLLVAIPSVVGYNIITSLIKATIVQMDNFVEEFIVKLKIEQLSTSR